MRSMCGGMYWNAFLFDIYVRQNLIDTHLWSFLKIRHVKMEPPAYATQMRNAGSASACRDISGNAVNTTDLARTSCVRTVGPAFRQR